MRGRCLPYDAIRICLAAFWQCLSISMLYVRCISFYKLTLPCVRTLKIILTQRTYSVSTVPYVRSYNVRHPAEQYLNTFAILYNLLLSMTLYWFDTCIAMHLSSEFYSVNSSYFSRSLLKKFIMAHLFFRN